MEELKESLQNIELLLQANISKMNTIVSEANDPEKRAKEAQVLTESAEKVNSIAENLNGLIRAEKNLLENFNPTVISKQETYNVNFAKPMRWIIASVSVIILSVSTCFVFAHLYFAEKEKAEKYSENGLKLIPNYVKFGYLKYFGDDKTRQAVEKIDKEYSKDPKGIYKKVDNREKQIEEAARASKDAELRQQEARAAKAKADSMNKQIK